jgi:Na+-transporting methylmalonyl-CoA/oxaloacetate decarboxylase gamma subunit
MVAHVILALAQEPATSVLDALPHLAGMLMVMVTLFILWGVCALTGVLIRLVVPPPAASPAVTRMAPVPSDPQVPPPEMIAVIAAAVASFVGPSSRIISIRRQSTTWEKVGRQSVLTSHRIR